MKIYTSYFARLRKLDGVVPIAVCRFPPKGWNQQILEDVAPTYEMLQGMKNPETRDFYAMKYCVEVLGRLNKEEVLEKIEKMTGGKDAVLVCYEKPVDFCHRKLIASWLGLMESEI